MMRKRWRRLSREQLQELWRRWKQRETLAVIGAALARPRDTVYSVVRRHGGIAPRPRRRAHWALSLVEREDLARGGGQALGPGDRAHLGARPVDD